MRVNLTARARRLLEEHASEIRNLAATPTRFDLLRPAFREYKDGRLEIFYAPFGHVQPKARIILVGITPGWTQMQVAYQHARELLRADASLSKTLREAQRQAAFSGVMRKNIVSMLDDIGLQQVLDLETTEELFGQAAKLLQTTSAIRSPVFVSRKNYTGVSPKLTAHPELRRRLLEDLAPLLAAVPNALVVPLGNAVTQALEWLADQGRIDLNRCLTGFPHPSGANGHRKAEFENHCAAMRAQVREWSRGAEVSRSLVK